MNFRGFSGFIWILLSYINLSQQTTKPEACRALCGVDIKPMSGMSARRSGGDTRHLPASLPGHGHLSISRPKQQGRRPGSFQSLPPQHRGGGRRQNPVLRGHPKDTMSGRGKDESSFKLSSPFGPRYDKRNPSIRRPGRTPGSSSKYDRWDPSIPRPRAKGDGGRIPSSWLRS